MVRDNVLLLFWLFNAEYLIGEITTLTFERYDNVCLPLLRTLLQNEQSCIIRMDEMDYSVQETKLKASATRYLPVVHISIDVKSNLEYTRQILVKTMNFNCSSFVLSSKHICSSFSFIYEVNRIASRSKTRKYFVMQSTDEDYLSNTLNCKCMSFFPLVYILKPLNGNYFDISAKCSVSTQKLGNNLYPDSLKLQDIWNNHTFVSYQTSGEDKLIDLNGIRLKLLFIPYYPWTQVIENTSLYDGIDYQMMIEISKRHNFTWEVETFEDSGDAPDNETTGTFFGSLKKLENHIAIPACTITQMWKKYFDFSIELSHYQVKFATPLPKLKQNLWSIFTPLSSEVWVAITTFIFFSSLILYFFSVFQNVLFSSNTTSPFLSYLYSLLNAFSVVVGLSIPYNIQGAIRHLLTWLYMTSTLLITAYNCNLVSYLTFPLYEAPIDSLQQLVDSGLYWGTDVDAWVDLVSESSDPNVDVISGRHVLTQDYSRLNKLAEEGKLAFVTEQFSSAYVGYPHFLHTRNIALLRLMRETVLSTYLGYIFHRGSPLVGVFSRFVRQLRYSGIYDQLFSEVSYQENLKFLHYSDNTHQTLRPLSTSNVIGCFLLLLLGIGLSFVAFILENLIRKCKPLL